MLKKLTSYLFPLLIEEGVGEVSPCLEVSLSSGKYTLNTSKVNYSYGGLHLVFDGVFKKLKMQEMKIEKALVFGFGAGSIASLLTEKYNQECFITGIEKDGVVIKLAEKYFNVARFKKLKLLQEDAFDFASRCSDKFDLIAVDVYIESDVPKNLHELPFIKYLNNLLSEKGILIFNKVVSNPAHKEELEMLCKNIKNTMGDYKIHELSFFGTQNEVVIFSREV